MFYIFLTFDLLSQVKQFRIFSTLISLTLFLFCFSANAMQWSDHFQWILKSSVINCLYIAILKSKQNNGHLILFQLHRNNALPGAWPWIGSWGPRASSSSSSWRFPSSFSVSQPKWKKKFRGFSWKEELRIFFFYCVFICNTIMDLKLYESCLFFYFTR